MAKEPGLSRQGPGARSYTEAQPVWHCGLIDKREVKWYTFVGFKPSKHSGDRIMRILVVLFVCVVIAGCATTNQTDLTRKDLAMFQKSFEGTLVNKLIQEYDEEVAVAWMPFVKKVKTVVYFQISVEAPDGTTRKFYDLSDDPERISVLYQYNRDLQKGDRVVIGLGLVDEGHTEEHFDIISRRL